MFNWESSTNEYEITGSTKDIRQDMLAMQVNLVSSIHLCYLIKITSYIMSVQHLRGKQFSNK